ncbi:uncharacterized protein LOC112686351 [Sipha flava]|uniref:Uncharacterized protein LOC112686351 n=1 Tax=Sipha flava TaxID=143950 RepID=A0A2S2Q524_9HEMI|nr:uncharacterized protein LOC112686351 [Sipha flava]
MMSHNSPSHTTVSFICAAVILHAAGVTICSTIVPDINPTPPLEFPSDGLRVRIVQATTESSNVEITKPPFLNFENNDKLTTYNPDTSFQDKFNRQFSNSIFKSSSQPINVIAKINENYTENYIENKYYNNRIEDNWSSILLTSIIFMVMAVIVLSCSALCLRKIQNLKISKRQLLIEDYDDSVMNDLIHVQHV